ncbi:MAG: lyase [Myxococcales bacterium]|nr:MAG: lyase [Myxococcales bacterium]
MRALGFTLAIVCLELGCAPSGGDAGQAEGPHGSAGKGGNSSDGIAGAAGAQGGSFPEAGRGGGGPAEGGTSNAGAAGMGGVLSRADDDPLPACLARVSVTSSAQLEDALSTARPGDCLELGDGGFDFPFISAKGDAGAPIVITAKNRGKARAANGVVFSKASYVAVEGLAWTNGAGVKVADSDHVRITRGHFALRADSAEQDWIAVTGTSSYTRIDHNELGPKRVVGNLIMLSGLDAQVVQHTRIDHNYFHDVEYTEGNGWESIRAGLSHLALSSGHTSIEHNLFERCGGDPETISIKSSDNVVRYNTILDSKGELVLRHGNRNDVYGNYFLGSDLEGAGGIRVCGRAHRIFSNYVQGVSTPAILLEAGDSDAENEAGTAHYRVHGATVAFNTVVNGRGIQVGGGGHDWAPVDSVVANNVVQARTGELIALVGMPVNTAVIGNIVHPLESASPGMAADAASIAVLDPQLVRNGAIFTLAPTSPAIDRATGGFDYVTADVFGRSRQRPDVGAEEYSLTQGPFPPLLRADVGPESP